MQDSFRAPCRNRRWVWLGVRQKSLIGMCSMAREEIISFTVSEFDGTATTSCLLEQYVTECLGSAVWEYRKRPPTAPPFVPVVCSISYIALPGEELLPVRLVSIVVPFLFADARLVFEYVAWLTAKLSAYGVKGRKPDRTHLACLEVRQIGESYPDPAGKLCKLHFPVRKHSIEPDHYGHTLHRPFRAGCVPPLQRCIVFALKITPMPKYRS